MKYFLILIFFMFCNSVLAEDLNCSLRTLVLRPTRDMLVPVGNDSRPGVFNTTLIRNILENHSRNFSNRLAVRLKAGESVELLANETEFRITQNSYDVYGVPGYLLKTKNREYLFYCGECSIEGRRPNVSDLLNLVHEDGEPFFKSNCVKPRNVVVPASFDGADGADGTNSVSL